MAILKIDRTPCFSRMYSWVGEVEVLEQDERSLNLTEIDTKKIVFTNYLRDEDDEIHGITGEERYRRILEKSDCIRLDVAILNTLFSKHEELLRRLYWKAAEPMRHDCSPFTLNFDGSVGQDNSYAERCVAAVWVNSHGEVQRTLSGFASTSSSFCSAVLLV